MTFHEHSVPYRNATIGEMSCRAIFPQRLVTLGLMLDKKDDTMKAQLVKELVTLENNELCVCGSGKKHKECCPNIKQNSVLAELLAKFRYVDQLIEDEQKLQGVKFICKKGCSDCCSQYFYVSMLEYFLIRNELCKLNVLFDVQNRAKVLLKEFASLAPQEVARWESPVESVTDLLDDKKVISAYAPCPLLNVENSCSVYNTRPLVCRLYGISNLYSICPTIYKECQTLFFKRPSVKKLSKHLILLHMDGYTLHENVDWFIQGDKPQFIRAYPLIYWLANDERYFPALIQASTKSISEFKKYIRPHGMEATY